MRMTSTLVTVLLAGTCTFDAAAAPPINRTVFVTATTDNGERVPDLTAADFVVKEGGKEREIVKAEPATGKLMLVVAVEEKLIGDGNIRQGLFDFMNRMVSAAEIRFVVIGLRNVVVSDFTSSMDTLVGAINKLTLNPSRDSNVAEGVMDIAKDFTQSKPARPAIVVVSLSGGQSGVEAKSVLDRVRDSGATMHAATLQGGDANATAVGALADQSGREQVLGDGPKQSGGRRINVTATAAIPKALQQIAGDLTSQYAISYALPDGVKPDRRLNVTVKRKGVTLRAPSVITDKVDK